MSSSQSRRSRPGSAGRPRPSLTARNPSSSAENRKAANGKEKEESDSSSSQALLSTTTTATVSLPSSIAGNTGAHPDAVHSLHRTVTSLRSAKIVRLSETATLFDCCAAMTENRVDAVLLTVDGNDLILRGILTDKDIVRIISTSDEYMTLKASGVMTRNPTCATPETSVQEALKTMVRGHFRHLPVIKDGKIVGLLDITKCLHDAIVKLERIIHASSHIYSKIEQKYTDYGQVGFSKSQELVGVLKEKMIPTLSSIVSNSHVPELPAQSTVKDAIKIMAQQKSCAILITEGNKQIAGIFTAKDLVSRVITPQLDLATTKISKVMTHNPDCATVKTSILDALHLMHDGRFLHLPILNENGKVVGLVDVLHLTYRVVTLSEEEEEKTVIETSPVWERFLSNMVVPDDHDKMEDPYGKIQHEEEVFSGSSDIHAEESRSTSHESESFSFKFKDFFGNVHRVSCAAVYTTLLQQVSSRVQDDAQNIALRYVDEDGDNVLIASEMDLKEAVSHAKSAKQRVLRLTVVPAISPQSRGLISLSGTDSNPPTPSTTTPIVSHREVIGSEKQLETAEASPQPQEASDRGTEMSSYLLTALGAVGLGAMAILRAKQ